MAANRRRVIRKRMAQLPLGIALVGQVAEIEVKINGVEPLAGCR